MIDLQALRREADAGNPRAQFWLARELLIGRNVPYGPDEALALVRTASAQGYAQATLFHAALAARGLGRPQSFDDAIALVAEAAATGDVRAAGQLAALGGVEKFDPAQWLAPPPFEQQRQSPRIFTARNFLSAAACAWLIDQSRNRLAPAKVKDPERGGSGVAPYRSNTGAGFSAIESDLVVQLTTLRIAAVTGLPAVNQEPVNVLHYAPGEEYRPHFDFVTPAEARDFAGELRHVGQRAVTVLVYLNEGYEGGETAFPRLNFRYKGNTGDALMFWNLSTTGAPEIDTLHCGLPVLSGEKWLLSKWVRQRPFPIV
jgi:prolyl 4-hydroxylase